HGARHWPEPHPHKVATKQHILRLRLHRVKLLLLRRDQRLNVNCHFFLTSKSSHRKGNRGQGGEEPCPRGLSSCDDRNLVQNLTRDRRGSRLVRLSVRRRRDHRRTRRTHRHDVGDDIASSHLPPVLVAEEVDDVTRR